MFSLSRPSKQETKGLILSGFMKGAVCHSQRLGLGQTPWSSHKAARDPQPPSRAHRPPVTTLPQTRANAKLARLLGEMSTHGRETKRELGVPKRRLWKKTFKGVKSRNLIHWAVNNGRAGRGLGWGFPDG